MTYFHRKPVPLFGHFWLNHVRFHGLPIVGKSL
ncbi:MAG: hypothetical protein KatS3mg110_3212 [Pirellulaceae bacterium]|nr:MAG: hypothetical protein KatS3mg110_3212 [Pirellulaceae bacterium]